MKRSDCLPDRPVSSSCRLWAPWRRFPASRSCSALLAALIAVSASAATVTWTGGSGDWGTPANWSTGALPGSNDDVVVSPGPAITVTHSSGTDAVRSIQSDQAIVLSGGSLAVSMVFQADGGITFSGGTVHGGTVVVTNGAPLVVANGTLDGVTIRGTLDVGRTANGASLLVTNGLVLNGTAYVGNPALNAYGSISFAGTQTLDGNGTVVFGGCNNWGNNMANALWLAYPGTALTIGPGITVHGQNGTVGAASSVPWSGPADVSLFNQGIILADVSGGTITISAQPFTNSGGTGSGNGGALVLTGLGVNPTGNVWTTGPLTLIGTLTNLGTLLVSGTGQLVLSGGNIIGGSVSVTSGESLTVNGSGTLNGVTLNGVLDVGNTYNGTSLTVTNGLVLNGTALVGSSTNSNYGSIDFAGTQALGGSGSVVFGGCNNWGNNMANALWLALEGTTLTIGPGITIHGQNGTVGVAPSAPWYGPANSSLVNQGAISADVSGGTITIGAQPFINQGSVGYPEGALTLNGVWDITGQTLLVDTNTALLNFSAGAIRGGTIVTTNGAALVVRGGSFDDVTVEGILDVGNSVNGAVLTVTNGLILNGTALIGNPTNGYYGAINFAGNQLLTGSGTVVFGNSGANALRLGYDGSTLFIEGGILVRGQNGQIGYSSSFGGPQDVAVFNRGTISADVASGQIMITAQPFSNQGLVASPMGILNLSGSLAGLGSIQSGNGLLELSGVLTNTGQTAVLSGATNTLTLQGGTILGGTIAPNNGAALIVQSGTLDGVTVSGVLDVGNTVNGANLMVADGLVLNGTALVGNPTNSYYGAISFVGTQELDGNGTVVFGNNGANALRLVNDVTTLVIGKTILVRGQNGQIGYAPPLGGPQDVMVVNNGTISADVPGGEIIINAQPFSNQGLVASPAGILNLGGSLAGLGNIQSGGGPLALSGVLTNTGQTLLLNGMTNTLTLAGGMILNGTTALADGAALVVESGTLNGVTVSGVLDVGNTVNGANLTVTNGLVLNGTALVGNPTNGSYGALSFVGSQELGGDGIVVFGNNGANALRLANSGTTLAIGGGVLVRGQSGQIGFASSFGGPPGVAVANQGTISADVTNGQITINAQPFTSRGLVQTPSGFLSVNLWENTGQTIVVSTNTGSLNLSGGTIHGGSIAMSNGVSLVVSGNGMFDGVAVVGEMDVGDTYSGVTLTVTNGLVLNGTMLVGNPTNSSYGRVSFAGSQTLSGSGSVVFGNNANGGNALQVANQGTTLILGANIEVRGQSGQIGYASSPWGGPGDVGLVNEGTISADVAGGTIVVAADPFNNQGNVEALAGSTLNLEGGWKNGGNVVAAGGTVILGGTSSLSETGGILGQGGTFRVTGALDNSNSTLVAGTNAGWVLDGGLIKGGRVMATNGPALTVRGGTLVGVTVNGDLDVGQTFNGASLQVVNGLVLNGTAYVGWTNGNYGSISFAWNQTLGGNGTVVFGSYPDPRYNALLVADGGTTLTIGPGIKVRGQSGTIGYSGAYGGPQDVSVINEGAISADAAGGTITVDAQPFTNLGLAESPTGVLTLGGHFDNGPTGTLNSGGGELVLVGVLDNAGQTLALNGATNVLTLNGGRVDGGTVLTTNGGALVIQSGILDGVTVDGVLDVGRTFNGASLTVVDGLVLNGTAYVGGTNGNYGTISFAWDQTLGGGGTVVFGSYADPRYNALLVPYSGTTLTIGQGITVRGQNGTIGYSSAYGGPQDISVINNGTIAADVAGGTITLNAEPMTNQGLTESPAGLLVLGGHFSNGATGTLIRGAGQLTLGGVLDNAGQVLVLNGPTNSLTLNGGKVAGGSVLTTNGAALVVQNGSLDGVTVNGVLDVGRTFNGASLTVVDGLVLNGTAFVGWTNGSYGTISFVWDQTLAGSGTVVFGSNPDPRYNALLVADGGTTLTIGPGITVRGQNGTIGYSSVYGGPQEVAVANEGVISVDVAGSTMTIAGSSFSNAGQVRQQASGGSINVTADAINAGIIEVDHGTVTFSGDFNQSTGALNFGLNSLADYGQIAFTGVAVAGGTLGAHLADGYIPNAGDSFAVLDYGAGSVLFTNTSLPVSVLWQTNYDAGVLTLTAQGILPLAVTISPGVQTVPVGATATLQASASGPGPFGYQWLRNGVVLAGATEASLVLTNVAPALGGSYTVQVSNPSGSVLSSVAQLIVLAPPSILTAPQSQTVAVGSTIMFLLAATGGAPLSYQWTFDGQSLPGATDSSLTVSNVIRAQSGSYSVVVTNLVGSVTSMPPAVLSIATGPCPGAPSGMLAWWRGEGNAGDYAGTNDASFEGIASYGPGEVGQAFLFDGSTSYLQVPNNPLWAFGTNDFTIEFWANFAQIPPSVIGGDGSAAFIGIDEGEGTHRKWLFGFGGQELYFYFNGPGVGPQFVAPVLVDLVSNQWYHLGLTKGNGVYRIYVNGAAASVATNNEALPVPNAPLTIGQAQGLFMGGLMDEISLYNRALAPGEIQAIYEAGGLGKCGSAPPPIRLGASVDASGRLTLRIQGGEMGVTFTIKATQDFKQWMTIGQVVKSLDVQTFTDPTPVLPRERFYRVSQVSIP